MSKYLLQLEYLLQLDMQSKGVCFFYLIHVYLVNEVSEVS